MSAPQIFFLSFVFGALLHLPLRQPVLPVVLVVAAITIYEVVSMLGASYTGGGASMWPIGLFFVVVLSTVGATLGVLVVSIVRKRKP